MPIIRSAKKKLRQDKKREKHNFSVKRSLRNIIKLYKTNPTAQKLSGVYKSLDTSVKKNILHANKAARLKSNLSKLLGMKSKKENKPKPVATKTAHKKRSVKKNSPTN